MAQSNQKPTSRVSTLLAVVAAIALPLAGLVWWLRVDLLNTERFVSVVTPVIDNPAVQSSLANFLTDTIFSRIDTTAMIQNILPNQNPTVAQLLNDALVNFSRNELTAVVGTDRFEAVWSSVIRAFHQQVSRLLLGQGQVLTLESGEVAIDVNGILEQLKAGLANRGLTTLANQVPSESYNYTLFNAPRLTQYQPYVAAIETLFPWLPLLVPVLFGLAIWLSADRTGTINIIGKALLVVAAVMALVILFTRSQYLNQTYTEYFTRDVAAAFFDAITNPLWFQVFLFTILGIFGVTIRQFLARRV